MKIKEKIPELRFPEFEGEWEEKRLGAFISKLESGVSVNSIDRPIADDSEFGILKTSSVSGGKFLSQENKYILPEEVTRAKLHPRKDSIIISRMNTPALVGEIGYIEEDFPNLFIPDRLWQTETNNNIHVKWLSQILITPQMRDSISSIGTGTSGSMKNIAKPNFLGLKINIPPLPEQQKIAAFLTALDRRIQLLRDKKQHLETWKKGLMQKIFNREIRFKDEQGKDFSDWEEKRLGDIATFSKGKGISKADIVEDGMLECIRYGELYTDYAEVIGEIKSRTNEDPAKLVLSEANDVIIPASGETQIDIAKASCVVRSGVALGSDLNIIKSTGNGVFLAYYLNNAQKKKIASLAQGISVVHLYSSQLKTLLIFLPDLPEQQKIAAALSAIDQAIDQVGHQIDVTRQYKKGLLQKMFV